MKRLKKIVFFGGLILIALFISAVSANFSLERRARASVISGTVGGSVGGSAASGTIGGSISGSGASGTIGGSVGSSISGTVGGGGSGGGGGSSGGGGNGGNGGNGGGNVLGASTGPNDNGQVLGAQFIPSLPVTGMSPFLFIPWLIGMLALIIWLSYYVATLERTEK